MWPQTNYHRRWGALSGQPNRVARVALGFIGAAVVGGAAHGLGATGAPVPLPSGEFPPQLNRSVYQPVVARDPFRQPGASDGPTCRKTVDSSLFHIDGLFGSTKKMTAIVNGSALSLNTPVVLDSTSGRIQVKAVKITYDGVILEIGSQRVEVKRATENLPMKPPR